MAIHLRKSGPNYPSASDMSMLATMRRLISLAAVVFVLAMAPSGLAGPSSVLPGFKSPSGNIRCLFMPGFGFMYCTIAKADYTRQLIKYCAQPKIGVDWAGFTLGKKGKGSIECSGGAMYDSSTQHPSFVTLPYGKTWKRSVFTCTSRINGVTCKNPSGHGLFIAREAWRAF
jgi:hypothetical protein